MALIDTLNTLKNKKILVIGDIMLDKYIWGNVSRISPEAPVQVVDVKRETHVPGGAANTANNISSLGAKSFIAGIVGNDQEKDTLLKELTKRNINSEGIITDSKKPTITKTRIMAHNQQLLRVDYEDKAYIDNDFENKIINFVNKVIDEIDLIIISDYAKGIITPNLIKQLIEITQQKNKKIIIDPKPKHKNFFKGVDLITPNHKEAAEMAGIKETRDEDIQKIGKKLIEDLNSNVLITRGKKGMALFEKNGEITNIPTVAKEVYDVSGAGDTVTACLGLAIAANATLKDAAIIANHAAGIVVGKVGTATCTIEELKKSIENE